MLKSFGSLFSGCEGAGYGARLAGLAHRWGVELNPDYAAIAKANGMSVRVEDVTLTTFNRLPPVDWLHASPPCQNASAASAGSETETDGNLAAAVCCAINAIKPETFSLENVAGYSSFKAFNNIVQFLYSEGYDCIAGYLRADWYGVPQSRKRLILVASRSGRARLPQRTHFDEGSVSLPGLFAQRLGWNEVMSAAAEAAPNIALVRPYELSDRMMSRIPDGFIGTAMMTGWTATTERARPLTIRWPHEPAATLLSTMNRPSIQPLIVSRDYRRKQCRAMRLTPAAMGILQSFPPHYLWGDNDARAFEAIGNAVPPILMQRIIQANL